ncbi:hypothetical protein Q9L58_008258 [Maublancomyces gigas]|uniref:Uncharacterized protein n=1 Tax=Discina gigas TaxID=1032678 RepID=A0ABR3GAN3_9PEZI
MDYREQILENCRWLFGQEVQIVLFRQPEQPYNTYAIVLPKSCTARTLANLDFNEHVLISAKNGSGAAVALDHLRWDVEKRISEILQVGSDGLFQVNKLAIPAKSSKDDDGTTAKPEEAYGPKVRRTKINTGQESDSQPAITVQKRKKRKGKKERVGEHKPGYSSSSSGDHVIGYASGAEPSDDYSPHCIKEPEEIDTEPPLLSTGVLDGGEGSQIENQSVNHIVPFKVEQNTSTTYSKTDPASNRSVSNDMPTTPIPEPGSFPNSDRKLIREEINLALRGILSDMMMQVTLQSEETHR